MPRRKEWFGEWFDSPYYHVLYGHRDYNEARYFIDNLSVHLNIRPEDQIMDLACGKGRHSIYLNEKGYNVVGLDLSEQNIEHAKQYENERLRFQVHDMRKPYAEDKFNYVLNMFTSFGYFETKQEHEDAICAVAKALKSDGKFVLDFLNPYTVINHLVEEEVKLIEGIEFHIIRDVSDNGYILKDIRFEHKCKSYHFQEKVKALRRSDFLDYFKTAGLIVKELFGDYDLNAYQAEKSERMIFVLQTD